MCKLSLDFNIEGNTPETTFLSDFTVDSLINTTHKQWNANLSYQVFNEDWANVIINTLLVPHVPVDRLVWKARKMAFIQWRVHIGCELVGVSHLRRPGYWVGIWKLNIPPKLGISYGAWVEVVCQQESATR